MEMARNPDYSKMQGMGKWLEMLLKEPWELWEMKELFITAVDILNIHYDIPYKHPYFQYLEEVVCQEEQWNPDDGILIPGAGCVSERAANPTMGKLSYGKFMAGVILKSIFKAKQPWHFSLDKILHDREELKESNIVYGYKMELFRGSKTAVYTASEKQGAAMASSDLHRLYSNIGERLILTEKGYVKKKVLLGCELNPLIFNGKPVEQKGRVISVLTTPDDRPLPFDSFIARILFDFLLMGGQDYFSYCSNCGRFIVSQRKGRRKTCSDTCRLALFHKKK